MKQQTWSLGHGILEVTRFPSKPGDSTAVGRKSKRPDNKDEKRRKDAARALRRILNLNFRAGLDSFLTLDYAPETFDTFPSDPEEQYDVANSYAVNYLRRCRRECNIQGITIKYVLITSCMDGKTGEIVRVHHHLVVNAEAAPVCTEQWKVGGSLPRTLYGTLGGDLSPLAEYLIAQTPTFLGGKKRYHPSRNLLLPEPYDQHEVEPDGTIAIPPGYNIIWQSNSPPGHPQVVRCMAAE